MPAIGGGAAAGSAGEGGVAGATAGGATKGAGAVAGAAAGAANGGAGARVGPEPMGGAGTPTAGVGRGAAAPPILGAKGGAGTLAPGSGVAHFEHVANPSRFMCLHLGQVIMGECLHREADPVKSRLLRYRAKR